MLITDLAHARPAILGLGYVGLPLAVEFGRHYETVGFDVNAARVDELRNRRDSTLEVTREELAAATQLSYSAHLGDIAHCNVFSSRYLPPSMPINDPTCRRCAPPVKASAPSSSAAIR